MMMKLVNWGNVGYREAWDRQHELFQAKIDSKLRGQATDDLFVLCEHPSVFTLGRNGQWMNMLLTEEQLGNMGVELVRVDRGGDITYHGPGQIVGYPIVDLERYGIGQKEYIGRIEEVIIRTIDEWGIRGERMRGATGVWVDVGRPQCRKIAAIGVRSSRYVTMHGFALNVNTDLRYFGMINPCGFSDKGVCSMQSEVRAKVDENAVRQALWRHAASLFDAAEGPGAAMRENF